MYFISTQTDIVKLLAVIFMVNRVQSHIILLILRNDQAKCHGANG